MTRKMLGILGGMGAEATDTFYEKLIRDTKVTRDQDHLDILIYSHASIPDRTQAIMTGKTEELWQVFAKDVELMKKAGCDYLTVTCNTAHYFQDQFEKEMHGHFISMIDEAAKYASTYCGKRIGVLGTDGTRTADLYGKALRACGAECVYPSEENQKKIMSIIYDEIKKGEKGNLSAFMEVIEEMREKHCDAVLIACTELSVLKTNYAELSGRYYLDALDVMSKVAIEKCGGIYQGKVISLSSTIG